MAKMSIILGPPGTGKTSTLAERTARAAQRYGLERVLVSSLTRAGAHQAARVIDLPFSQIGTVHSFAYRALGNPPVAEGHIKEWNDTHPGMVLTSHSRTGPDNAYSIEDQPASADLLKMEVSRLRTLGLSPAESPSFAVMDFYRAWEDWKAQCGYVDFTDMVETALKECPHAPGQPAVIIDDEAQDTGLLEMRLLLQWAQHDSCEHMVFGGDSAQALFGFRGSDPLLLQNLWKAHDSTRAPLPQSYRLSEAVYNEAYTWAGRFQETMRIAFKPRPEVGQVSLASWGLHNLTADSVDTIVRQAMTDEAEAYYQAGKVPLMFLATCGYMLEPLMHALKEAGLPFYNPWRREHGGWNPLPHSRAKGLTIIDRVLAFTRPRVDFWGDEARYWTGAEVKAWASALPATGNMTRGGVAAFKELSDHASDEHIAGTMRQWLTPEALAQVSPVPQLEWYLAQVKGSTRLREYVEAVIARAGIHALKERPRIVVGTCHSLKGSEAFQTFLCPDISVNACQAAMQSPDQAEEMRRTFYVGMTRAYHSLTLLKAGSKYAVGW